MDYFAFQWHITDECDQRCQHCYIFAEHIDAPVSQMSYEDMVRVLDDMLATCERFDRKPYIYLTGGDPILHGSFWRLLELLSDRTVPFTIMGNPFHLDDEVCARLAAYGCEKYQLSLDGLRDTHDAIRKPGSFDTTLGQIARINNAGMKSVVMTTVSGANITEIPSLIDLVVEHGVRIFAFARYCPTSLEKDNVIEPLQYRDLLDVCWKRFERYESSETSFNLKDHLWTLYLHEKGLYEIPGDAEDGVIYDGCNCGNCHMTVLPSGDVYACRRMESKVGNVFEESLYDIFLGDSMDEYRAFAKFEKCAGCELLRFCRGCPAVAYGRTGSHFAPDPQCWKEIG